MSCGEKGSQMPEEDGVKQNRSSLCNKELVLGKAGLKTETFKQMNWCRKNQRDTSLSWLSYVGKVPWTPVCAVPAQDLHGVITFWRKESEEL